jgi:hypothetical protein
VPNGFVSALMQDGRGTIWAGGSGGLSRFRNGRRDRIGRTPVSANSRCWGLLKDTRSQAVVRTLREVRTGERPLAPEIAARLAERTTRRQLGHREHEVLELIARA